MRLWAFILVSATLAPAWAEDRADLTIVNRIREEAFQNSQVMETLFYLTDVHGPRVTNSAGFHSAADWAVKRLQDYGLVNVKLGARGDRTARSWVFAL